ncbi:MAG: ferritin-like domain-containing protein [Myxococcota bacterium]|nr:ferritin-like domain-containing protein [Myxococcota bacterium]
MKTSGKKACDQLCREVFNVPYAEACGVDSKGETSDVWMETTRPSGSDEPEEPGCAPGRRPAGLAVECAAPASVAAYLAWAAQMEAASVTAFARVHRGLVELGADVALQARVRTAIADELAHAHAMVALARRYGAQPSPPVIEERELSLVDRAIENAVEGCVGETVAAIHAAFLATHARDAAVRDVFAQISVDEAHHALLSYDLAREYAQHLDANERTRVHAAYADALLSPAYRRVTAPLAALGVPDDGSLAATIDHALAALAPRLRIAKIGTRARPDR